MPSFADDVVLDKILGIAELQEDRIRLAAGMAEAVIYIVVADLASVHVRKVDVGAIYCHIALDVVNPAGTKGEET